MLYKGKDLCDFCFSEKSGGVCENCKLTHESYRATAGVLEVGANLIGKYIIGKTLGRGGFGATYIAFSSEKEKRVAVKEYLPMNMVYRGKGETKVSLLSEEKRESFDKGAQRFFEEAKTVAKFNSNENVVSVYEFFYTNDTAYYSMECLDGCDLRKYVQSNGGRLSEEETVKIAKAVCNALAQIHNAQTLHRDIAPDNIFMCKDGKIKLIDFGSAKQFMANEDQSYSVVVKDGFAPPEQYTKRGKQGGWTDIYALGGTMYYMLTGKLPLGALDRAVEPGLDFGGANVSNRLKSIITRCMETDINKRYKDAGVLLAELNKFADDFKTVVLDGERVIPLDQFYGGDQEIVNNGIEESETDDVEREETIFQSLVRKLAAKKKETTIALTGAFALVMCVVGIFAIIKGVNTTVYNGGGGGGNNSYVEGHANSAKDFLFELSGDEKSYVITGYKGSKTVVNIPAEYKGKPVVKVAADAFKQSKITRVVFSNTVESIEERAFYDCDSLTDVYIPASVESVGYGAFLGFDGNKRTIRVQLLTRPEGWDVQWRKASDEEANNTFVIWEANGEKIFEYPNGDRCDSGLVNGDINGVRNGYGRVDYANGDWYEGQWKNNKRSGEGNMYFAEDDKSYNGNWENDERNGYGVIVFHKTETVYEGEWKNDLKHGYGSMSYKNGDKYDGNYINDKRNGQGTMYYAKADKTYVGDWSEDKKSGQGRMTYHKTNNYYEGSFDNDKFNGYGKYYYKNGDRYEGNWKDNEKDGQGTYYYVSKGRTYKGEWKKSKEYGQGTMYYDHLDGYCRGKFSGGVLVGYGTYYFSDGSSTTCQEINGELYKVD